MSSGNFVNVRLRCDGCTFAMTWCVRVSRNVPEPLRCTPGGGGRGQDSGIHCPKCGRRCFESVADFEEAVNEATSGGWGQHVKAGAVEIRC